MRKRSIALTFFVIIALCFHACDFNFPEEVEIKVKPELSAPVNGDMSNMIFNAINDAAKKNQDINLYQYEGRDVMTFLFQYNILKDRPLDFLDKFHEVLDEFRDIDLDIDKMSQDIELGDLSNFADKIGEPITIEVDLGDVIRSAETALSKQIDWHEVVPIVLGLGVDSGESQYESVPIKISSFDTITFANGIFSIEMEFTPRKDDPNIPTDNLDTVDFEIESIWIKDQRNELQGTLEDLVTTTIRFNDGSINGGKFKHTVYFDLKGVTLDNVFKIYIIDFTDFTPSLVGGALNPKSVNLEIQSGDIKAPPDDPDAPIIRGVKGYENKYDKPGQGDPLNPKNPLEFELDEQAIELAYDGSEFIHAQVGVGTMNFKFNLPREEIPNTTWLNIYDGTSGNDLDLEQKIFILQDLSDPDPNGNLWPGLCDYTTKVDVSTGVGAGFTPDPWEFDGIDGNLINRHINLKEIKLLNDGGSYISKVTIPEGMISFMLDDVDIYEKKFEIVVEPEIKLKELINVHINPGDVFNFPDIDVPVGEAAKYLSEIRFENNEPGKDKVGIEIKFGQVDIEGLTIMISEPNLEINTAKIPQDIVENGSVSFTRSDFIFDIKNMPEDGEGNKNLKFEVKVTPIGAGEVVEIPKIDLENELLRFRVDDYKVFFVDSWTEAVIDLSDADVPMDGSFPEEGEDPINLAEMLDVLEGFTIDGIKSFLYIDGPNQFFGLKPEPKITFEAKNGEDDEIGYELFDGDFHLVKHNIPKLDEDGDGKFKGVVPEGIKVKFDQILNDRPTDLQINYNIELDGTVITPEVLQDKGETLNIAIIVVVPMSLKADPVNGAKIEIPGMFKEGEDAFGRKNQDDIDFINSLTLNVEFNDKIFNGGVLYMKREGEEDGSEDLKFDLAGKALKIPIKGSMLETIRNTYPYSITETGIRFKPNEIIQLPEKLEITKIEFDVDITFRQKL